MNEQWTGLSSPVGEQSLNLSSQVSYNSNPVFLLPCVFSYDWVQLLILCLSFYANLHLQLSSTPFLSLLGPEGWPE